MAKSVYLGSKFFKALSPKDDEEEENTSVNPGNIQQSPQVKKVGDGVGSRGGVTTTDVRTSPSRGTRNVYQSERTPRRLGNIGVKQGASLGKPMSMKMNMPKPPSFSLKPPTPPKPPSLKASLYLGEDLFFKGVDDGGRMYNPNLKGERGRVGTSGMKVESFTPPEPVQQRFSFMGTAPTPAPEMRGTQQELPLDTPKATPKATTTLPSTMGEPVGDPKTSMDESRAPAKGPALTAPKPATAAESTPDKSAPAQLPAGTTEPPKAPGGDPTKLPEAPQLPKPPSVSMTTNIPGAKETKSPCSTGINPNHSYVGKFPGPNGCIYVYSEGNNFNFRNSVDGHAHHDEGQTLSVPHDHPDVVNNNKVPIPEKLRTHHDDTHIDLNEDHSKGWNKPSTEEGGKHHVDVKPYHPEDNSKHPGHLAPDHLEAMEAHKSALDRLKNNSEEYHSTSADALHQEVGPHGIEQLKEHHGEYP